MKVVKIEREHIKDVVETLEHFLELAKMGEATGITGILKLKDGYCRKFVHGEFIEDIPKAIGELETVKMWLYGELTLYEVPERDKEIKEIKEEIEKEKL